MPEKNKKRVCFVVGPIGADRSPERRHADLLLGAVIEPALLATYEIGRADRDPSPGNIGTKLLQDIASADLVVADLTFLNPNAFYELGIRHTTEKPTIHMAALGTQLPFDNLLQRTIFFDLGEWNNIQDSVLRLRNMAEATESQGFVVTNPFVDSRLRTQLSESKNPVEQVVGEQAARLDFLEETVRLLQQLVLGPPIPTAHGVFAGTAISSVRATGLNTNIPSNAKKLSPA